MSMKYRLLVSFIWSLTIHDEVVHEEIALEPSCESSDTSTLASQIVEKITGNLRSKMGLLRTIIK